MSELTLGAKRRLFTALLVKLINRMISDGYAPMIGRDGEKHMENSLHYVGLAQDIILTKDGVVLDKTEDHTAFGEYWENLHPLCKWGGRFKKKDGNHYSISYEGRA